MQFFYSSGRKICSCISRGSFGKPFYFLFILFITVISFRSFSQPQYFGKESNNIRIDPEWVKTHASGDFCWAYDTKTDKKGNVYCAGYFQRNLKVAGDLIEQDASCSGSCPDTYFLMKQDEKGNVLWVRYANGTSRPAKIAIDKKGFVYVVGNMYSEKLSFTSTDSVPVTLNKPADQSSGIFFCKYDGGGKVVATSFYSEKTGETASDMVIDNKGNIYLGGHYTYTVASKPGESIRSHLLVKFNSKFEVLWREKGTSSGNSFINTLVIGKDKAIYVGGGYQNEMDIAGRHLEWHYFNNSSGFVAKFSEKGKLSWLTDSVGSIRDAGVTGIVSDSKGSIYVLVPTSISTMFFSKLDDSGNLIWTQSIVGRASTYGEGLRIDEDDGIYLYGFGNGAVFGSKGFRLFSYKSVDGTDFFFAKYTTEGECLWLKAGGGSQTDYCKSISIHKKSLYAFGWFATEMQFRNKTVKGETGYTFWTAKFNLDSLEKVDWSPEKLEQPGSQDPDNIIDNEIACGCSQEGITNQEYIPSLDNILPYAEFEKAGGWKYAGKENAYQHVYLARFQTSTNFDGIWAGFTALMYRSTRFEHPDKTFVLDISPCAVNKKEVAVETYFNYEHTIRRHIDNFEVDSFDRTARSYFVVAQAIAQVSNAELLNRNYFGGEVSDIRPEIAKINTKYKTKIVVTANTGAEECVEMILAELERKKISFPDFMVNEFVLLGKKGRHSITEEEERHMASVFYGHIDFSVERMDRVIYPQVNAELKIKRAGIGISEKIIRKWDGMNGRPARGKNGESVPVTILAKTHKLDFTTADGVDMYIREICLTSPEITGTGILLNFSLARLLTKPLNYDDYPNKLHFPLFVKDSVFYEGQPMIAPHYQYTYDSLFSQFTGLFFDHARATIPYKGKTIKASMENIMVNNKFICGVFEIDITDSVSLGKRPTLIHLPVGDATEAITIQALKEHFVSIGLREFTFGFKEKKLRVYFKKKG